MAEVKGPNFPSWASSQRASARASPRTLVGTWGRTTPSRLTRESAASRTMAKRTLVSSHQTARRGRSRPAPTATARRAAPWLAERAPGRALPVAMARSQDLLDAHLQLALLDGALHAGPLLLLHERPSEDAAHHAIPVHEERCRQPQ